MRKAFKRMTALIIMGALLMGCAGCKMVTSADGDTQTASEEEAMGRYMETQIEVPENFSGTGYLKLLTDGTMVLTDSVNGAAILSKDEGASWETVQTVSAAPGDVTYGVTSFDYGADGSIFYSFVNWDQSTEEKTYPETYVYINAAGEETRFELGLDDYSGSAVKSVITNSGKIYLLTMESVVYEINPESQSAEKVLTMDNYSGLDLSSTADSVAATDGGKIYFIDAQTGEIDSSDTVLNDFSATASVYPDRMVFTEGTDGKIYTASGSGIYGHSRNGNAMEQLAEGGLTNLSAPSATPNSITVNENGTIFILYQDGSLFSYIYDANVSAVPEQMLTIYSLYTTPTTMQAVSSYRKEHPDVYVKLEVGITGKDSVTENDAILALNTKLLADEGPDLILLQGMPIDSYMEKGMLTDLTDLVSSLEESGSYYENILNAYQNENGLFAVPIRYYLPYLSGTGEQLASITDLTAMADVAATQAESPATVATVFGGFDEEELLSRLYQVYSKEWYAADGSVMEQKIVDFLTQAKRIYEADNQNVDSDERAILEDSHIYANTSDGSRFYQKSASQSYMKLKKEQTMEAGFLTGMQSFRELISTNALMSGQEYKLWKGASDSAFIASAVMGISSNSKNKEMAEDFLRTALSTEVQKLDLDDGFPVNKEAFSSYATNPVPDSYECIGGEDLLGNEIFLPIDWPEETDIAAFEQMAGAVSSPAPTDIQVEKEVVNIGKDALTGEKGIDECAKEISQKITLQTQE